jgi:hypothetical protein
MPIALWGGEDYLGEKNFVRKKDNIPAITLGHIADIYILVDQRYGF